MNKTGELIKQAFSSEIESCFIKVFGENPANCEAAGVLRYLAGNVFEIFYQLGDAPYHDHEHTYDVCVTGQVILTGMHLMQRVTTREWMNFMVACLGHDIGYVFGILPGDQELRNGYLKNNGNVTGASLTPLHVDRSKAFMKNRFGHLDFIDPDAVSEMIEYTRFDGEALRSNRETGTFPGLVRAADLIGQMASPQYLKKMWHLYHEFEETGALSDQPFDTVDGMRRFYPDFYDKVAGPLVQDAIHLLEMTMEGRMIVASLYYNLYHTMKHPDGG